MSAWCVVAVSGFSEEEGETTLRVFFYSADCVRVDDKSLPSVNKVVPVGGVWLCGSRSQLVVFCYFYFYARGLLWKCIVEEVKSFLVTSSTVWL